VRSSAGRRGSATAEPRPRDRSGAWRRPSRPRPSQDPETGYQQIQSHRTAVGRYQLEPTHGRVEVTPEFGARRRCSRRKRSDDQRAAGCQSSEAGSDEVPQPPGDPVTDHRVAYCLAHNEANPDGGSRPGQLHVCLLCRHLPAGHRVHDEPGPPSASTVPGHMGEVAAAREPGGCGQHGVVPPVRPTVRNGSCGDARRGSPAPHGYACAAGTRGSWRDGGCSAGRCACPCSRLSFSRSCFKVTSLQPEVAHDGPVRRWMSGVECHRHAEHTRR
jgi:hypothetical protein